MSIMPQEFRLIARLSDESCAEHMESQQPRTAVEFNDRSLNPLRDQAINSLIEQPIGKYLRDAAMYLDAPME